MGVGRSPPDSALFGERFGRSSLRSSLEYAASVGWFPAVVTVWFFLVQPSVSRFRLFTLRSTPPSSLEELPVRAVGVFAHVLFHDPTQRPPLHLLKNLGLFAVAAVGFRISNESADAIRAAYARLVVVTPPVSAAVFLVTGQTKFGYGASTVGFAVTGYVAGELAAGGVSERNATLASAFLCYATVVFVGDIATGGLATALHATGFLLGASYAFVSRMR
ncbi:hypothetical protein [Halopelagius fulvigenes]|uniref:Rhomboid family intramembrane serine protease n=1 Tax=Halopelagius fulvigenes TaxID=1198324 RepID=A0ABD5TT20_9EURY